MKKAVLIGVLIFLLPSLVLAKREHPEKWYQEQWCEAHKGRLEVVLQDGTRCDCLTDTHAIEFDFGSNWAEAVGQSAYYALQTERKAGIVLILESIKDRKYWIRLIRPLSTLLCRSTPGMSGMQHISDMLGLFQTYQVNLVNNVPLFQGSLTLSLSKGLSGRIAEKLL